MTRSESRSVALKCGSELWFNPNANRCTSPRKCGWEGLMQASRLLACRWDRVYV